MKYYTLELLQRFSSDNEQIALAAQDELEQRSEQYTQYLKSIAERLPPRFRELQERFYLHDSRILWPLVPWLPHSAWHVDPDIARETIEVRRPQDRPRISPSLMLHLELDAPPKGIIVLHYRGVRPELTSLEHLQLSQSAALEWQHDEIELAEVNGRVEFLHSILFGDGLELRIQFTDFDFATLKPMSDHSFPLNGRARTAS